jgi:hypothetical protein
MDNEPRVTKRRRRPSLQAKLKAARRAGAEDVKILPDGTVSFKFGETVQSTSNSEETNPWDEV